jgi:hypothetical protein
VRVSETRDTFDRVKTWLPGQTSGFSVIKNEGVGSGKPCGWDGLPANQNVVAGKYFKIGYFCINKFQTDSVIVRLLRLTGLVVLGSPHLALSQHACVTQVFSALSHDSDDILFRFFRGHRVFTRAPKGVPAKKKTPSHSHGKKPSRSAKTVPDHAQNVRA